MKILHISPSYYPAFKFGGPVQSVHLLNKYLVKKGISVDVLTTNAGLSKENYTEILRQTQDDGWNYLDGVRVKYLNYWGYEHYNFSIQFVREIKKNIRNYDLVHITAVWNFPVLAGAYYCNKNTIPYIISTRGVFHKEALKIKSGFKKKFYFKLFTEKYLNKAAAIHFTTQLEKEESATIFKPKNSFVIPNGIDLTETQKQFSSGLSSKFGLKDKKYILFLGRIHKIKGLDLLISAFNEILKKYPDIFLVIAGDDSVIYTREVKKIVNDKKINDKVIFTGEVTGDDKWSLYKNAMMFVLPSYSENFGMAIVEAMACGCPIVISDKVGIYNEVKENNAGIIVETNIQSVEQGITRLLIDAELRKNISINGKAMVEKYYDIDKVAELMIDQYKNVLKSYNA